MSTFVLSILANDAKVGDRSYRDIGANTELRLRHAAEWVQDHLQYEAKLWAFGAGTDAAHAAGPTLALLAARRLHDLVSDASCVVNERDRPYYGTFEEITWIVQKIAERYEPGQVTFVFFTQADHQQRVQLIWNLFYQHRWGEARFVTTPTRSGSELNRHKEWLKRMYVRMLFLDRFGIVFRPRNRRKSY